MNHAADSIHQKTLEVLHHSRLTQQKVVAVFFLFFFFIILNQATTSFRPVPKRGFSFCELSLS